MHSAIAASAGGHRRRRAAGKVARKWPSFFLYSMILSLSRMEFPWRWDGGTVFTNLERIWEMSVQGD